MKKVLFSLIALTAFAGMLYAGTSATIEAKVIKNMFQGVDMAFGVLSDVRHSESSSSVIYCNSGAGTNYISAYCYAEDADGNSTSGSTENPDIIHFLKEMEPDTYVHLVISDSEIVSVSISKNSKYID